MNPKIIGIILLIVGLGVGLYVVNSGAGSKLGSLFNPPSAATSTAATSTSTVATTSSSGFSWSTFFQSLFQPHTFSSVPANSNSGGSGSTGGSSGGGQTTITTPSATSTVTPPAGFTVAQLSPYYKQVKLSGVSRNQITLSTYPSQNIPTSTVDITGWEIKTNHGGEFVPQAINVYNPSGQNQASEIILAINKINYVNIYSNSAPANLRLNACMGYLNTPAQFKPGFSNSCPSINRSQISQYTGACQNYILSLGCQTPNPTGYYYPRRDYQCQEYLSGKFTYNWCVSTYATSANFLSNEWRVWMGATPLDPYHDIVELLDKNGLLVDVYSY